jgi:DNA-binding HxlR family transcriptional regulator
VSAEYGQYFCPITRAAEIFATRWTPLIVRNLLQGCTTFSEIRDAAPGIPRSLLTERLRALELAGVVQRRAKPGGPGWLYELTDRGRDLGPVCDALGTWGQQWLEANPTTLDPGVLLWAICRSMDRERLPEQRVVVSVAFHDVPSRRYWMLVQRPDPEVCRKSPGYAEDLLVTTDTQALAQWHMGKVSLGRSIQAGAIEIQGPRRLVRAFAQWGGTTPFALLGRNGPA